MRYFIYLFILLSIIACAQTPDAPSAYTDFLRLRLYDLDDYPGADSLNANSEQIDEFADDTYGTLLTYQTKFMAIQDWNTNTLKDGIVYYDDFNASLKTKMATKDLTEIYTGTKTFNATSTYFKSIYPILDGSYNLGSPTYKWKRGYFDNLSTASLIIRDPANPDDTTYINFTTDGGVVFNDPVTIQSIRITNKIVSDSSVTFPSIKLQEYEYNFTNVADSMIIIDTLVSNVELIPPGNMARVIGFSVAGASEGTIVMLFNTSPTYTITLKDNIYSNLYGENEHNSFQIAGDLTLGILDNITLKYTYIPSRLAFQWMQIARSDN